MFDVTVLQWKLNYRVIYKYGDNVYRANCDLDKIKWKPHLNSLVKLPSVPSNVLDLKTYYQGFLTYSGVGPEKYYVSS